MKPKSSSTLVERSYRRLREEVRTCVLFPGQVVTERELARRYRVSKTPIREALTQLCREGLIERLPGRGYMVVPVTVDDVRNLFDLRLILENAAAERAACNPSSELISGLRGMAEVSYSLEDPESHRLFLKTNRDFHLALAEGAANRRLVKEMERLLNEMERLFHLGLRVRDSSEEMRAEHREVVSALEAGDVAGVKEAITRQIMTSRDRILEAILKGDLKPVQVTG